MLVQAGAADEVLNRPLSLDIAEFSAAENIIPGTLLLRDGRTMLDCGPLAIEVVNGRPGDRAVAVIRPEDILVSLEPITSSARNSFRGTVRAVADLGAVMALHVDCSGIVFTVFITRISWSEMNLAPGIACLADLQGHFGAPAAPGIRADPAW